jgi:hypothetical protein
MKQEMRHLRRAGVLIAAAALPATALLAQDMQPVPEAFQVEIPPPVATEPIELPAPEPVVVTPPAPAPVAVEAPEPAPAAASAARRTSQARATPRTATRAAPRPAQARAAAPAPEAAAPAAAPASAAAPAADAAAPPPPAAAAPPAPAAAAAPAAPPAAAPEQGGGSSNMLWIALGALALGALALFALMRRRRRIREDVYDETPAYAETAAYDETPAYDEPVHDEAPVKAAAPVAAVEEGRPALDIALRPIRAGVSGNDAIVEFELDVDNRGSAAARDVRVSTWMFAAGESEAERALIDYGDAERLPSIPAGRAEHLSSAVTLPTSRVESDAVLPVVVAEARYRLPDGSEATSTATYAVGVQDGEDLAHFAIDNPSGLHEEVVAWEMGRTGDS